MKKILICVLLLFSLISCDKEPQDYKNELVKHSSTVTKYNLKAQMKVVKTEGDISFDISVSYLEPNYYKVRLQNTANNNIQVIVKNNDGVFVITPALNKQFQFSSNWPLNSSHAYLYQSIVNDIKNDSNSSVVVNEDTYTITSKIDNKTNGKMKTQKVEFDKKTHVPVKSMVYDDAGNVMLDITFNSFDAQANLKASDFNADLINNTIRLELSEGVMESDIVNTIPTFMPEGYDLNNSIVKEEYSIQTYKNAESVYTITKVLTDESENLTVSRTFNDLIILENTIGFVNEKSVSFFYDNLLISIYNENFNLNEAILIANSFFLKEK